MDKAMPKGIKEYADKGDSGGIHKLQQSHNTESVHRSKSDNQYKKRKKQADNNE